MITVKPYVKEEHEELLEYLKTKSPISFKGNTVEYIISSSNNKIKILRVHKKLMNKKIDLDGGSIIIRKRTIQSGKMTIERVEIYYGYNFNGNLNYFLKKYESE